MVSLQTSYITHSPRFRITPSGPDLTMTRETCVSAFYPRLALEWDEARLAVAESMNEWCLTGPNAQPCCPLSWPALDCVCTSLQGTASYREALNSCPVSQYYNPQLAIKCVSVDRSINIWMNDLCFLCTYIPQAHLLYLSLPSIFIFSNLYFPASNFSQLYQNINCLYKKFVLRMITQWLNTAHV